MGARDEAVCVASDARSRHIAGRGTDEEAWCSCSPLKNAPTVDLDAWIARYRRIWIVSPHPDDEVLALGGTMARLSKCNADLRIVSVTAGTASHLDSRRWPAERLAWIRPAELRRALTVLDIEAPLFELGLPDGDVAAHADKLARFLAKRVAFDDLIIAPWRWDGHPDHEATAKAAVRAAESVGADLAEYPIWLWHWATPHHDLLPWARVRCVRLGDDERAAKRKAIEQFVSQVTPDDDSDYASDYASDCASNSSRPAILPPHVVARFTRPFEVLFC